jgi:hypothetical protein
MGFQSNTARSLTVAESRGDRAAFLGMIIWCSMICRKFQVRRVLQERPAGVAENGCFTSREKQAAHSAPRQHDEPCVITPQTIPWSRANGHAAGIKVIAISGAEPRSITEASDVKRQR